MPPVESYISVHFHWCGLKATLHLTTGSDLLASDASHFCVLSNFYSSSSITAWPLSLFVLQYTSRSVLFSVLNLLNGQR